MPANIKIYKDLACTQELDLDSLVYELLLGPEYGLDGDLGDVATSTVYLTNSGDKPGLYVRISKEGDVEDRIALSDGLLPFKEDDVRYGTMNPPDAVTGLKDVRTLQIRLTIPAGTPPQSEFPVLYVDYKTLA